MDIYILRDGQESGPFSERAVRQLVEQGDVAAGDLAWRPGMPKWAPLSELLAAEPVSVTPESPKETPDPYTAGKQEPATPKQKALLSFLGAALPADLSRDQAARLVNDAMEDAGNAERLAQWNEERLRLHPELFAVEIQARKDNRANHFFELCQTSGAEYFSGITKAHCQVLVGFLDVKFPHWDAREAEAADHYFFPAVAEKFPQLVHKQWRGRLRYADGLKVSAEIVRKSPTSKLRQTGTSPLVAVTRGLVLGVVILGVLYLGYRTVRHDVTAAPVAGSGSLAAGQAVQPPPPAPAAPQPGTPPLAATTAPHENLPSIEPVPPLVETTQAPVPIAASSSAATPGPMAEPGMSPAPPVADPFAPVANAPTAMAPVASNPPMAVPPADAPPMAADPATMAMNTPAVATAPMAGLPGTEPPVPIAPPPATMPAPAVLPSTVPEAAPAPSLPPGLPEPIPLATASSKTNLLLTKPVEVQLAYGKIMLPTGTPVKLVSRQGTTLKVSYRTSVISVPVASTDLE